MDSEKKQSLRFLILIAVILTIGLILSSAVLLISIEIKSKNAFGGNKTFETHTVTFMYSDGTVIDTVDVEHGKGVFPPLLPDNGVFRGWSRSFNNVTSDIEVQPHFYKIKESNLFYFNSMYVKEGEQFTFDVNLGGAVGISKGNLTIEYDTEVLSFESSIPIEGCRVEEEKAGEITLSFERAAPITEGSVLAQMTFNSKKVDAYCTELSLKATDAIIVAGGREEPADSATINNKIYFLQEVDE